MPNSNTSNNNTSAESTLIGFLAKARNKKVQKRIISLLSVVVLLVTLNQTKLIADTLQRIPMCGIAEHMHDEVCVNEAGEYICGLEEHAHTDACYQQRPMDIEEAVEAEVLETHALEAPVAETSVELSDEGEIAEPAPTVDDEAVVSGDVEEIPSETVVELGEDEEATDEALTPAAMPLETEESSPVFDFEGRDYVALSEILPVLPLQMEEVVDVLAVLDEDQETSPIIIEKVEQDYTIYVIERFAWTDIAVETEDGLKTITLIDGGTREEDLRLQTEEISVTTEEMVGDEKAPNEGGSEEQTVAVPAEGEEEQTETVPAEGEEGRTETVPAEGEVEQTVGAPTEGEEEQTAVAPTEDEEEQTAVTPTEGDKEQTETVPTEGEKEQTVTVPTEGDTKQTMTALTEGEEEQAVDAPTEGEEEQAVAALTEDEEEQDGEGQSDEEATDEGTDDHTDGDEEGDTSVAVEGAEDAEQTGESAVEDGADESEVEDETEESKAEGDGAADEAQEPQPQVVADGFHAVIDLSEVEALPLSLREIVGKMEAEQSLIEQSIVEPAVTEETDASRPEVIEEQIAEDAQSFEDQADDNRPEAQSTENIESMDVEPAAEEVVVELGEEQADDTVVDKAAADETATDETTVDYDSALLSLAPVMDGETMTDYAIDVIADFDSTDIIVDGQYTITLLNGVNPCPAQSFTASTEYMNVSVTADVGAFPAGTTMEVSDVVDDETISGIADSVTGHFVEVERVHAVDISFRDADGREIEPKIPISVVMTVKEQIEEDRETVVVHLDNEGGASVVEAAPAGQEENADAAEPAEEIVPDPQTVAFTSDSFSVYAVVVTRKLETSVLASDGETYKIEVTYGPDAGIPDGAVLAVSEVTEDEEYRAQVEAGLAGNKMITLARFFDIKIMDGEEEIHPAEAVEVRVWLDGAVEAAEIADEAETQSAPEAETPNESEAETPNAPEAEEAEAFELEAENAAEISEEDEALAADDHIITVDQPMPSAAHFSDETVTVVDAAEGDEAAVVFTADGFSVWGVVYTVDFYYGNYEWHMDGGTYTGLTDLVEKLNIAEDAAAFVSDVKAVEFSAPELLSVSRVEEATTVGAIKEALGLECDYSLIMTEEQIAGIEATSVAAGDWALISLKAFQTQEKLSITLNDGTLYEITVEDDDWDFRVVVNDPDMGYIGQAGNNNMFIEYTDGGYQLVMDVKKDSNGKIKDFKHISGRSTYSVQPIAKSGYEFVCWLRIKADGSWVMDTDTRNHTTLTSDRAGEAVIHIAFFAPIGDKVVVRAEPTWPTWVYTNNGEHKHVCDDDTLPRYSYVTQDNWNYQAGIDPSADYDRTQYEFLGWYDLNRPAENQYLSMGQDDGDMKHNFDTGYLTNHTILQAKWELKEEYRDYCNVWFDGSNGILANGGYARNSTMYSRINGQSQIEGAKPVYVQVNNGDTVTLPTSATPPLGSAHNNFVLKGWYMLPSAADGAWSDDLDNHYYDVSEGQTVTVTINRDTVFYADWFPANYNIGLNVDVMGTTSQDPVTNNTLIYKSRRDFITTHMFDYNTLFNMESIRLLQSYTLPSDAHNTLDTHYSPATLNTRISNAGNFEYWQRNQSTRDFLFITALSDNMRAVSPDGRQLDNRNASHELSRLGDIYAGYVYGGILSGDKGSAVKHALFDRDNALGKRYAGEGDMFYLYDDNTGYYYYDSDKNAASFNAGKGRFYIYKYKNMTDKSTPDKGGNDYADFLPFNYSDNSAYRQYDRNGTNHTGYSETYGEPNYWFGMESDIRFFLPNQTGFTDAAGQTGNRSAKGDEMVFKFCGDDDVWVYVDDELVLDMGGVHGKVYGEINFSKGTATVASGGAKKVYDSKGIMGCAYNDEATESEKGEINNKSISFAEGKHTLRIYYLERGASQSNCAIYFNIAPAYAMRIEKKDAETRNGSGMVAKFGIYTDEECTQPADITRYYGDSRELITGVTDGWLHLKYFYGGRTYYIKELEPPEGYPSVSDRVIRLTLSSIGEASVAVREGDQWVTPEDNDIVVGDAFKYNGDDTSFFPLIVYNRKNTNVTVRKTWRDIDGNEISAPANAEIKLTLKRYKLIDNPVDPLTDTHKVQIVVNYMLGQDGAAVYSDSDVKTIRRAFSMTYAVNHNDTLSFTATANHKDRLAIYTASNVSATRQVDSESYYGVLNSKRRLPVDIDLTTGPVTHDTMVYLYFIGDVGEAIEDHVNITEPQITTAQGAVRGRVADKNFVQEVTLPLSNNWSYTWSSLESADSDGNVWHYYVRETGLTVGGADNAYFYSDMYSSYGISGGTIDVTNQYELVKVKLRKQESGTRKELAGARFMIYTSYDPKTDTGTQFVPKPGYVNSEYEPTDSLYTSQSNGNFYIGYLPLGRYWLVEREAPSGYNRLTEPVLLIVESGEIKYKLPGDSTFQTAVPDNPNLNSGYEGGFINIYIDNTPGYALPSTGGLGTTFFYVCGSLLTLFAAALLLCRKHDY